MDELVEDMNAIRSVKLMNFANIRKGEQNVYVSLFLNVCVIEYMYSIVIQAHICNLFCE